MPLKKTISYRKPGNLRKRNVEWLSAGVGVGMLRGAGDSLRKVGKFPCHVFLDSYEIHIHDVGDFI